MPLSDAHMNEYFAWCTNVIPDKNVKQTLLLLKLPSNLKFGTPISGTTFDCLVLQCVLNAAGMAKSVDPVQTAPEETV